MATICKAEKIGQDISYVIIQRGDRRFSICLTAYDKEYETDTGSVYLADKWIENTINTIKR
jgi:hypothetical protein